jgi:hypothetical protein
MKKIVVIIVICLLCLGIAAGVSCLTSHEFTDVATTVRTHMYPSQLKTKFTFRFGPMMILAAKMVLKQAAEEEEPVTEYLQEIRKVQVGIYDVQRSHETSHLTIPPEAETHLTELGWESFVRVRQEKEQVSLFYKQINEEIVSIYAIVFKKDELFIVEVQGRLENIIRKAVIQNFDEYEQIPFLIPFQ